MAKMKLKTHSGAKKRFKLTKNGKTFARTVGTDEELKNGEAFTEVCTNRNLDDLSARVRHEAAHTGKLTNLVG